MVKGEGAPNGVHGNCNVNTSKSDHSMTLSPIFLQTYLSLDVSLISFTKIPVMTLVWHGHFSFDGTQFTTSPQEDFRVARVTNEELRDISDPSGRSDPDLPWYQAQLMHFGLPASNHKPTAKMRLLDAFQDGTLTVPCGILKLEDQLRKEWRSRYLEGDLQALSLDTGNTVKATIASEAPAAHLGSPFCPGEHIGTGRTCQNQSQKRKATGRPDLQVHQPKRTKSEGQAFCPIQNFARGDGCYGVTLSSHFNAHNPTTMSQGKLAPSSRSEAESTANPLSLPSTANTQTRCQPSAFSCQSDHPAVR